MPAFTNKNKSLMKHILWTQVHNLVIPAKQIISSEATVNTNYPDTQQIRSVTFNLRCSIFNLLSGKSSRIFKSHVDLMPSAIGMIDESTHLIEWVREMYPYLTAPGVVTNSTPSATSLKSSTSTFQTLGVRLGAQVLNVTDGSTAYVTSIISETELVTSALTGGTLNLYTATNVITINNENSLEDDDQIFVENRWRVVLAIIRDSEHVQSMAFVKDA